MRLLLHVLEVAIDPAVSLLGLKPRFVALLRRLVAREGEPHSSNGAFRLPLRRLSPRRLALFPDRQAIQPVVFVARPSDIVDSLLFDA